MNWRLSGIIAALALILVVVCLGINEANVDPINGSAVAGTAAIGILLFAAICVGFTVTTFVLFGMQRSRKLTDAVAPPGWYPDPGSTTLLRYFDGRAWTGHTAPKQLPPQASPLDSGPRRLPDDVGQA